MPLDRSRPYGTTHGGASYAFEQDGKFYDINGNDPENPISLVDMPPIAFVHVDADQYQSLKDAIRLFVPRMVKGASIVFDDYKCLAGADQAIAEWEDELGYKIAETRCQKGWWTKP